MKIRKDVASKNIGPKQDTKMLTRKKPGRTTICNNDITEFGENLAIGASDKNYIKKIFFFIFWFDSIYVNYVRPDLISFYKST